MASTSRPATLAAVAHEAGVSLATASRVLNGSARRVNNDLRAKVLDAALKLNYSPNLSAQAVARGRSQVVALVISDIVDPYFSTIASGVVSRAEREGLVVTISISERRPGREIELIASLRRQRPRVIIVVGSRYNEAHTDDELIAELSAYEADGGRVTVVGQAGLPFDTIQVLNYDGAFALATALIGRGYSHPAIFAGPVNLATAVERTSGFVAGFEAAGLPLDPAGIFRGDFTRDGGYRAASDFVESQTAADVIFAVTDVMAVGATTFLREAGVALPADLAIAGFDDILTLRDVIPTLTTVHLPLEEIGVEAVGVSLLPRAGASPTLQSMGGQVVMRDSTPDQMNPASA